MRFIIILVLTVVIIISIGASVTAVALNRVGYSVVGYNYGIFSP